MHAGMHACLHVCNRICVAALSGQHPCRPLRHHPHTRGTHTSERVGGHAACRCSVHMDASLIMCMIQPDFYVLQSSTRSTVTSSCSPHRDTHAHSRTHFQGAFCSHPTKRRHSGCTPALSASQRRAGLSRPVGLSSLDCLIGRDHSRSSLAASRAWCPPAMSGT
jgi:hypothetical protein